MAILSLALYGSCARGDQESGSDVDLLAIVDEKTLTTLSENKISVSIYPQEHITFLAASGDLFALHLVTEAKVLYDAAGAFDKFRSSFKYKPSYSVEKKLASDLGWFLLLWSREFSNTPLLNKRVAWCVRTILIAEAAEQRRPVFSARDLADLAKSETVYRLIKSKDDAVRNDASLNELRSFLEQYGTDAPSSFAQHDLGAVMEHFHVTKNAVAVKTAEGLLKNILTETYI